MRVAVLYFTDFPCNVFVGCWIDLFVAKWPQMAPEVDHWEPFGILGRHFGCLGHRFGCHWAALGAIWSTSAVRVSFRQLEVWEVVNSSCCKKSWVPFLPPFGRFCWPIWQCSNITQRSACHGAGVQELEAAVAFSWVSTWMSWNLRMVKIRVLSFEVEN